MKYRTKPCVIEALEFKGTKESAYEILKWAGPNCGMHSVSTPSGEILLIETLEGDMRASPGDFIIRGLNGEFYPCKPEIFRKKYEIAEPHV